MSEERREGTVRQDVLGILLFSLAVFLAVSVVLSMVQGMPSEGQGGTSALVGALVELLGPAPCLIVSIGLAFLGARQWVAGPTPRAPLEALGLTGAVLGLAILLGALTRVGTPLENPAELAPGGSFGAAIGGFLTRTLTVFLAAPIGLALALAPIWWVWIRPTAFFSGLISKKPGQEPVERAALSMNDDPGVSTAEAEALLPPLPGPSTPPESPYPEDVRLQGELPAGTRPIQGAHARSKAKSPAQALPLDQGPPQRPPAEPPRENLAEPVVRREREPAAGPAEAPQTRPARSPAPERLSVPEEAPPAPPLHPPEPISVDPPSSPVVATNLPAASWEQPDLFEAEAPSSPSSPSSLEEPSESPTSIAELSEVEEEELETAEPEVEEAEDEEYEDEEDEEGEEGEYAEGEEYEDEDEDEDEDEEGEYDEDEEEEGEEEESEEPEEEVVAEREVVLEPQAPAASETEPAVEKADPEGEDLIYRAGCLILDRGRVAVSMLQREFSLDFKEATKILDELQESGLIGPYMGGQSRDILMTPKEWRQSVGVE